MKKAVVIALLAFHTAAAFGQQGNAKVPANVSMDLPTAHPDMMTYFQREMTSLMRFQAEKERLVPFFAGLSFNFAATHITREGLSYDKMTRGERNSTDPCF